MRPFIISSFSVSKIFHKPINRLAFYACFGNVMANIGTLISTSGVSSGPDGPLCQFLGASHAEMVQVYAGRCIMNTGNSMKCLPHLLSQVQSTRLEILGMEIQVLLLWHSFHSSSCLPLHHCSWVEAESMVLLWCVSCYCDHFSTDISQVWCWVFLEWEILRSRHSIPLFGWSSS